MLRLNIAMHFSKYLRLVYKDKNFGRVGLKPMIGLVPDGRAVCFQCRANPGDGGGGAGGEDVR